MRGATRAVTAGGISIVLFAVGGVGLLRGGDEQSAPARPPATALLAPVGGGLAATIDDLQRRLRARGDDWRSYAALGLAYLQEARRTADPTYYTKAEGVLDRSLALESQRNFDAVLGHGVLALARHEFGAGLRWGRRASRENPSSPHALAVTADALVELGRYGPAGRAVQEAVDLRPELPSYARVSYLRELAGDVPGAIQAMRRALDSAGTPQDASWAAFQLGELLWNAGRIDAARDSYAHAAALSPQAVLPGVGLAKVAASRGRFGRAIGVLSGVVERYPSPEIVALLGDIEALAGRGGDAARRYELVRAMSELQRAGGVNTDLETALFDADHRVDLGGALARARAAYRSGPSIRAADALAWTLSANDRNVEAWRYAREAMRLGTRDALVRFHAGVIAMGLGREAAARRLLGEALAINPHFSFLHARTAQRALARLGATVR